jgi:hypothetical protein
MFGIDGQGMRFWHWRCFSEIVSRVGLPALLVLSVLVASASSARAKNPNTSEACRQVIDALMTGNVDIAVSAVDPAPADRATIHDSLTRVNYSLIGLLKGKKPRLERTLQDIHLQTHPVSLQIWSFSEQEVYLVGCLLHWRHDKAMLDIQFRNSVDDIRNQMIEKLKQSRS